MTISDDLPKIDGKFQVTASQFKHDVAYHASKYHLMMERATEEIGKVEIVTDECEHAWELAFAHVDLGKLRRKMNSR